MGDYLKLDVRTLEAEINALLQAYPELAEDDDLRADMLEGETDLERVASRIVRRRNEARAMVAGITEVAADLADRKERFQRREDAMKALLKVVLSRAQTDKLVLPEATISITKARESVAIIDADALPQGFFTTIRQPDKAAISAAFAAGESVPGAAAHVGETGLTIRSK